MVTMLKMLGLPVMGYVAPDINGRAPDGTETRGVTNGGEPKGYVLGTRCVMTSDTSCIPWDTCGYETYASLHAMSSSCATCACNFRTHALGNLVPIIGCNVQGKTYYGEGRSTVAADYDCNYKVNEANIPYIAGDLIDHGNVSYDALPMDIFDSACCCWSDIASDNKDQYWNTREINCVVKCWDSICAKELTTVGCTTVGLVSCIECFGQHPIDDTSHTCQGFLMIARLYGVTTTTDGFNRRAGAGATSASVSELTPNDGEYLAKFYRVGSCYHITHLFEYNPYTGELGSNRLSDAIDNADEITISTSATCKVFTNNQDGIAYPMFISNDLATKGIFVVMPLGSTCTNLTTSNICEIASASCLQKSFANHMDIDANTNTLKLYSSGISGYTCPWATGCAVGSLWADTCADKVLIGCMPIPVEYITSKNINMLHVGHWDICDKISSTAEAQLRLGAIDNTTTNQGG